MRVTEKWVSDQIVFLQEEITRIMKFEQAVDLPDLARPRIELKHKVRNQILVLQDLQQVRHDLRELCQEILDDGPIERSKLDAIQRKYGWGEGA